MDRRKYAPKQTNVTMNQQPCIPLPTPSLKAGGHTAYIFTASFV